MTIAELIASVLTVIRRDFYAGQPARDYLRDERSLTKAITRYGYECNQRGWQFDAAFIQGELLTLLRQIKRTDADVKYFPVYLDGAIARSIGLRAETLAVRAKAMAPKVARIIGGVRPVAVVEKTDVEVCAAVYRDLKRRSPRRRGGAEKLNQEVML